MNRFRDYLPWAQPRRELTVLSHDQSKLGLNNVGQVSKKSVNAINLHNPVAEWIGTPRKVHAPPGAPFGKPTNATSSAVFWKKSPKPTDADTRPNRQSLIPTRDATPPNPGRPEYGGGSREV